MATKIINGVQNSRILIFTSSKYFTTNVLCKDDAFKLLSIAETHTARKMPPGYAKMPPGYAKMPPGYAKMFLGGYRCARR